MLRDFVQKEIELRRQYREGTLSFGDWMKHIRQSHDDLLRLLTEESGNEMLRVEVVAEGEMAAYEVPANCKRIVVQTFPEQYVCGFAETLDGPRQIQGRCVGKWPGGLHAALAACCALLLAIFCGSASAADLPSMNPPRGVPLDGVAYRRHIMQARREAEVMRRTLSRNHIPEKKYTDEERAKARLFMLQYLTDSGRFEFAAKWCQGIVKEFPETPSGQVAQEWLWRKGY